MKNSSKMFVMDELLTRTRSEWKNENYQIYIVEEEHEFENRKFASPSQVGSPK